MTSGVFSERVPPEKTPPRHFVNRRDVRVIERRQRLRFPREAHQPIGIIRE
jgi:hypothetical protein